VSLESVKAYDILFSLGISVLNRPIVFGFFN